MDILYNIAIKTLIISTFKPIQFDTSTPDFVKVLRKRVNNYFKENKVNRNSNGTMIFKTIFMLLLFYVPYTLMYVPFVDGFWYLIPWAFMGFGMAGIGLSVMHDGNHNAYSKNQLINKISGFGLNLMGGYDLNWRIQHNLLHHTYTNIDGMDEDVDAGVILRFSSNQKRKKHHRFQHLYAWLLYSLLSISWITNKDFIQVVKYHKMDLLKSQNITFGRALLNLFFWKIFYFLYILVIPLFFLGNPWVHILGFLIMHFIAGFFLSTIFLCAHIVDQTDFPEPDNSGQIKKNWYVHQLETTANFSNYKSFFSWFIGGLNYQIEHHLFPSICHVHYHDISKIVKETAEEYNIPYHANLTFFSALKHHYKHLKLMGKSV